MSISTATIGSLGVLGLAIALVCAPGSRAATDDVSDIEIAQEADALYCTERQLGTWFYCDPPRSDPTPLSPARSPRATLAAIGAELEERKARAILEPTPENVTSYIRFQRAQLDRSSMFADVWQRALWQDPGLDYTLQRPVSTLGKRAWLDQRNGERDRLMADLSRRYGVFYFFSSSCGACDIFAPILKAVSDRYAFPVLAVSMDGGPSTTFRDYMVDSGQYERLGLGSERQVPALVLFDSVTRRPMPIGYGILSQDEILDRVFQLTTVKSGSDF